MADELQLALLGRPQVALDGTPVKGFVYKKALALLCYLVVTGRPHSRETLAGLLWGELPEANARANLRNALANLRELIAPHLVVTRREIAFDRKSAYWLDVAAFCQRVEESLKPHDGSLTDKLTASLREAVELYRGDFMEGFHARNALAFEEWVVGQREWLKQLALRALYRLSTYYIAQEVYEAGIDTTRRLLALEPWQEEAHRQLMLLLAFSGQRSAALTQYEICRRALAEGLSVEPAEETKALYEQIRERERGRQEEEKSFTLSPPLPVSRSPGHNLPLQLTPFFGREGELARLGQLLRDPAYRLVTLVGMGGVGKTRLALAAAEQARERFAGGVWFVPLAGFFDENAQAVVSHRLLITGIAKSLNLSFHGQGEPEAQLLDFLRHKEALLLLDSFEHLIEGADFILEVLQNAPRVTALVTTRARLNLQAEYAIQVEGLPVPPSDVLRISQEYPVSSVTEYPYGVPLRDAECASVQLFAERAKRTPAGFTLDGRNLPAVIQICQAVEGLPLGIELAAAQIDRMRCADVVQAIEQNLDSLATPMRDVPMRQQSIRAVFESSYRSLSSAEQAVLSQAAVFYGPFSQKAARAVLGDTAAELTSLVSKSLIRQAAPGRYELHDLVRQFAAEKIKEIASSSARGRHSDYYLTFVAQRERAMGGLEAQETLAEIRDAAENVQQAWRWAVTHANVEAIHRSIGGLSRVWQLMGLFSEGERIFGAAAEQLRSLIETTASPSSLPKAREEREPGGEVRAFLALGKLLAEQARFLNECAEYDRAIAVAQAAIDQARSIQAVGVEAAAYLQWGEALWRRGDSQAARPQLERALACARAAQLRSIEASSLRCLGIICGMQGDYAGCQERLEQALHAFRETGDRHGETKAINSLGVAYEEQGDHAIALSHFEHALSLCRELGDGRYEAKLLDNVGVIYFKLGEYARAKEYTEQALHLCRELGDRWEEGMALNNLGLALHCLGDNETALEQNQQALRVARDIGDRSNYGDVLTSLGHILLELERPTEAVAAYQEALELRQALGQPHLAIEPLTGLAQVSLMQKNLAQAQAQVEEILRRIEISQPTSLDEPGQVYLTCYRGLNANNDSRAKDVLSTAYYFLQKQAAQISDEELRRSFLENVAAHREIVREWANTGTFV